MNQTQATIGSMIPQSLAVLTQPSVSTFERYERGGGVRQAFTYVLLAALVSAVIAGFFAIFRQDLSAIGQFVTRLVIIPLGFFVFTYAVFLIGKALFQGTGTYDEVAYTYSLFFVPISIVATVIGIIPILGTLIAFILGLANIYFGWLAVQSSMNIRDQGKAAITLLLSGIAYALVNWFVAALFVSLFITSRVLTGN